MRATGRAAAPSGCPEVAASWPSPAAASVSSTRRAPAAPTTASAARSWGATAARLPSNSRSGRRPPSARAARRVPVVGIAEGARERIGERVASLASLCGNMSAPIVSGTSGRAGAGRLCCRIDRSLHRLRLRQHRVEVGPAADDVLTGDQPGRQRLDEAAVPGVAETIEKQDGERDLVGLRPVASLDPHVVGDLLNERIGRAASRIRGGPVRREPECRDCRPCSTLTQSALVRSQVGDPLADGRVDLVRIDAGDLLDLEVLRLDFRGHRLRAGPRRRWAESSASSWASPDRREPRAAARRSADSSARSRSSSPADAALPDRRRPVTRPWAAASATQRRPAAPAFSAASRARVRRRRRPRSPGQRRSRLAGPLSPVSPVSQGRRRTATGAAVAVAGRVVLATGESKNRMQAGQRTRWPGVGEKTCLHPVQVTRSTTASSCELPISVYRIAGPRRMLVSNPITGSRRRSSSGRPAPARACRHEGPSSTRTRAATTGRWPGPAAPDASDRRRTASARRRCGSRS